MSRVSGDPPITSFTTPSFTDPHLTFPDTCTSNNYSEVQGPKGKDPSREDEGRVRHGDEKGTRVFY